MLTKSDFFGKQKGPKHRRPCPVMENDSAKHSLCFSGAVIAAYLLMQRLSADRSSYASHTQMCPQQHLLVASPVIAKVAAQMARQVCPASQLGQLLL